MKHAHNIHQPSNTDLNNEDNRKKLAKILMKLFDLWQIDTETQLDLLGLSSSSRALLSKYRQGNNALSAGRDTLDRAGWLLAIHKALRLLYPQNPDIRYGWVKRHNQAFNNQIPLDVMKQEGIIGLAKVARYLDYQRGR